VLTSMVKHVDVAVYNTMKDGVKGFQPGLHALGLKEGGVDYAMDDNNKSIVSADMQKAVEMAKADIISGKIAVHDYMADSKCPVE